MAMCMEDGTLHRFRAHNTVLATGGQSLCFFQDHAGWLGIY
jgi:succinate dehydrogenase/fumarate reductase flavoprotein subunit